MFYGAVIFIIFGTIASLFYFSFLMPLHVDEGSYWFHFTNRTWPNRFDPMVALPHHTLTIYMAKWSLPLFGYNGIGLRFPVIFFGVLSLWLIHSFAKNILSSGSVAVVSSVFLALSPIFVHYSHELRGYPSLLFFALCSYYCLYQLTQPSRKAIYWLLLFLSFVGCYLANFAALLFFTVFLSTIWILRILIKLYPLLESLSPFKNISVTDLFIYSFITTLFFVWVVLGLDHKVFSRSVDVYTDWGGNYIAIPDMFSTFFGYKYLDDPKSLLYSYPILIWLCGLFYFSYGGYALLKKKSFLVPLFSLLFGLTASIYALSGTFIPVRSAIYLLPFIVIFQAYGLKEVAQKISRRWFSQVSQMRLMYVLISGYLVGCFFLITLGKFSNLDGKSGNPYEQARDYLLANSGPNDLIISSLYDTVGGFYFGEFIRNQNENIFQDNQLQSIYYLTPNKNERAISLPNLPLLEKHKLIGLNERLKIKSFKNNGVRGSNIDIYKINLDSVSFVNLKINALGSMSYFGNGSSVCKTTIKTSGFSIGCKDSPFACAIQPLISPKIKKGNFQIVFFRHKNKKGTQDSSFALFDSLGPSFDLKYLTVQFFEKSYLLNNLIADNRNLDLFHENVEQLIPSIQKIKSNKNILFCMVGNLFNNNSTIQGIKIFDFKISQSSSP